MRSTPIAKIINGSKFLDKLLKNSFIHQSALAWVAFIRWCKKTTPPPVVITSLKYSTQNEAIFETKPYDLHKLDQGPATTVKVTSKEALNLYRLMKISRWLENAASKLYKEKKIRGFCHLYTGQEAVAVGVKAAMRDVDSIITSYRCHPWAYLMNGTATKVLAELTGRKSGCSRGKGGSMHMYSKNFYGGNGIVGAQVPLGAGVAFAHKYRGTGGVCFTLYGDGAANQGQLFEAFNISKLLLLPVVFVCENNGYGMGTCKSRSSASIDYYTRGDYIPGIRVDGMDVLASREVAKFAIEYCSSGKGPLVVEMDTYRYAGHSVSDPGTSYRSREEVQAVRKARDPIARFKEKILGCELVTTTQIEEIDAAVRKEIEQAVKNATDDEEPGAEEVAANVYVNYEIDKIRGTTPLIFHKTIDMINS